MLIDYDVSTFYEPVRRHRREVGTDGYMAPEVQPFRLFVWAFFNTLACFLVRSAAEGCKSVQRSQKGREGSTKDLFGGAPQRRTL